MPGVTCSSVSPCNTLTLDVFRERKPPPRQLQCRGEALSQRISYHAVSGNVKGYIKMILDPHPDSDQHQSLTTSRASHLAHAYHVWSTSVNAFVSYLVHRVTDRRTDGQNDRKPT